MKKKITVFFLIILILFSNITVYGENRTANSDIWGTAKNWISLGKDKHSDLADNPKWDGFNDLSGIIWGVGVFVIIICGAVLGIKYIFESAEGKAKIKSTLLPYVLGSVIILGALTIWKLSVELLAGI